MEWKELSREAAEEKYNQFMANRDQTVEVEQEYQELRTDLVALFNATLQQIGIKDNELSQKNYSYQLDYRFGLQMYQLLNDKYGMNVRLASTEGVWRYLSVIVVPDLVDKRYNKQEGKDHPDRFWKKSKRIWLRVIWWYIYLSWQGTQEATANVLKDNNTDEILQLVDRSGRGGYRVELFREIMLQYSQLPADERRRVGIFRKMMVLNTARVQVLEPALTSGGNRGYVESLTDYFWKRK